MKITRTFNSSTNLTLEAIMKSLVNNNVEKIVDDYVRNINNESNSSKEKEIA